jgi:hypothetical protein
MTIFSKYFFKKFPQGDFTWWKIQTFNITQHNMIIKQLFFTQHTIVSCFNPQFESRIPSGVKKWMNRWKVSTSNYFVAVGNKKELNLILETSFCIYHK